jgi:UrcA family protein
MRGHFSCGAALLGAGVLFTAPALAQSAVGELTVTGHFGLENAQTLSETVSYADLDLSTAAGRDEFKHRISLTARYLCGKLGEDETSDGVTPSCRDAAVSEAMTQARPIIAAFKRQEWMAGAAWTAPYPPTWEKTYPDTPYR